MAADLPVKNKKNEQKNITLFRLQPARDPHDPRRTWHGDKGGPSRFCTPLTFLIRSGVSPLGAENFLVNKDFQCPHRVKMLITWLFVSRKQAK